MVSIKLIKLYLKYLIKVKYRYVSKFGSLCTFSFVWFFFHGNRILTLCIEFSKRKVGKGTSND